MDDLTLLVGVLVGLIATWLLFIGLLWLLRPRDARLRDLVRIVPDILDPRGLRPATGGDGLTHFVRSIRVTR